MSRQWPEDVEDFEEVEQQQMAVRFSVGNMYGEQGENVDEGAI